MLNLIGNSAPVNSSSHDRRSFLKVGTLGLGGLSLSQLLKLRAAAKQAGFQSKDTSVVLLYLYGGPTHVETFDPKMSAPAEYRSIVGAVDTKLPGVQLGALYPELARRADKMAFIRSFAHGNSGHSGGTHFVMTGYDHVQADAGAAPIKPSYGSILAKVRGSNHPATGIPTYVGLGGVYADGPEFLGAASAPFYSGGQARANMTLAVEGGRVSNRRLLLDGLDRISQQVDRSGLMEGLDSFESQAFDLILGQSKDAFDLDKEDPRTRERYQACGHGLGEQLLLARRLCEAGAGFVTVGYANSEQSWDMHSNIKPQLEKACPPMDQAIATFLDDLALRGMSENVLLMITGEFGRTPRINGSAGRDHWGPLCTLAFAGGGLRMGQVVGESTARIEVPKTSPILPKDVMATLFHVLGIDAGLQFPDQAGRPQYLLPDGARPIAELI